MSKTILITGTSTGFGKLAAIKLAEEGYSVIAAMRNIETKNAEAAKELNAIDNIEVVELDVTSEASVQAAVAKTLKKYGSIDVYINNAGVTGLGVVEAFSIDNMKNMFDTNLWGTVRGYQAVLPSMRANKSGLIINVSSGLGLFSAPYIVPYNMSKFAIQGLTEGIRHEIKPFGIETVTILPGPFPTEIAGKTGFGADKEDIMEAYGTHGVDSIQEFGGNMFGKIEEYKMDPQEIADALSELIAMKPGTRPTETVVNRIGEGVEKEFSEIKADYYQRLMKNHAWDKFVK